MIILKYVTFASRLYSAEPYMYSSTSSCSLYGTFDVPF